MGNDIKHMLPDRLSKYIVWKWKYIFASLYQIDCIIVIVVSEELF